MTSKKHYHCRRQQNVESPGNALPPPGSSQHQGSLSPPAAGSSGDHSQPGTAPPYIRLLVFIRSDCIYASGKSWVMCCSLLLLASSNQQQESGGGVNTKISQQQTINNMSEMTSTLKNDKQGQPVFSIEQSTYACLHNGYGWDELTFSRSGSVSAKASSLLSITEAAATSRGVAPRMDGEAEGQKGIRQSVHPLINYIYVRTLEVLIKG